MIRIGTNKDVNQILHITNACAKKMIDNGIYQWNDYYPNKLAFEKDIKRNELYVLEIDDQVIGCKIGRASCRERV